jgi:IMP dehydrogenase
MDMREALTFHDVLLVPKRSSIASRKHVSTAGRFSRRIVLKVPIVSANMDTVTEARMAIALARVGGLGVIHRFLTVDEEVAQVAKVKRAESIVIEKPYTIGPDETVGRARGLMREHGVGGLLVVDAKGKLVGIVTERDVQFRDKNDESLRKVMTTDLVTAPPNVGPAKAREILRDRKVEKLPLVDEDGRLKGLITAKDLKNKNLHPDASLDGKGRLLVGAAVGVVGDYLERSAAVLEAGADCLVVDVAHGHADHVIKAVETMRKNFPKAEIVAGNVATYEGARDLAAAGADGVKVGVGPGSICSTRIVSGAGVPQLTAIMDCAKITREKGVPIIADGGLRDSGDLAKAFAAGASSVMLGSLLAGAEESPGWTVVRGGSRWKIYRGMASLGATLSRKTKERRDDEDLNPIEVAEVVPEGVESMAPYKGPVAEVIHQLIGGVRSGMSYCGSSSLPELWKKAEFVRITSASWAESRPHHLDK